ncbi:Zn-ribbon domain-containing OB-fold protein [Nocardia rhamnosiphila]|uniref:Zn-ribbon domain-containing OB-fold protein n=1 Tax=Nocardia rhamnosiphila TaxID=426716 RepID=A0ABV2WRB6_9NOCA
MTTTPITQSVHWDLHYDIHLGRTWGRFMEGLKEGRIWATRCAGCARVFVPPQAYCESCFEPIDKWQELGTEGTLEVFSVAWHGFTGGPTPPYAIGGIRLDGASTLLMHWIVGIDFDDPATVHKQLPLGTRVQAVWATERTGQILDITHFEPVRP